MTVMVFGVFDGLHDGHKFILNFAKEHGQLVVVVARDSVVQILKNKTPRHDEQQRMAMIWEFLSDAVVVLGDAEQGSYEVVKTYKPDKIALGFDQQVLGTDLKAKNFDIAIIVAKEFNRV